MTHLTAPIAVLLQLLLHLQINEHIFALLFAVLAYQGALLCLERVAFRGKRRLELFANQT